MSLWFFCTCFVVSLVISYHHQECCQRFLVHSHSSVSVLLAMEPLHLLCWLWWHSTASLQVWGAWSCYESHNNQSTGSIKSTTAISKKCNKKYCDIQRKQWPRTIQKQQQPATATINHNNYSIRLKVTNETIQEGAEGGDEGAKGAEAAV